MTQVLETKDTDEDIVVTFDFSNELASGETLSGVPTITVTVVKGTDPSPSAILSGAYSVSSDAKKILQPVIDGVPGVQYRLKCVCPTSNPAKKLARVGLLPVVSDY